MYEFFKSIAKRLFPGLLHSQEDLFRKVLTWRYKGSSHQCTICKTHLAQFIQRENGDFLCPRCGSLGRTRRLFTVLPNELDKKQILHFSPPITLKKRLVGRVGKSYKTTDYEGEFEADYKFDITNIDLPKQQFDLVICYHVLEHIIEDIKAMSELYRISKIGGEVYIQTPFKDGALFEDYSISSPEDRLKHYGQADHVRIYTVDVLEERLESVGFKVERRTFEEEISNYHGFKSNETILIARK